ncbi:polysaccharide pyruvyl transferase family protein [Nocardioides sp. Y6]|uniref:Polysaccharide pyruvyl transferase family protein n=1 Tax=Nocardioides malaquae TaxID=2773426 RepID=A0ABR9RTB2_9ACTN|nr:polysaccharide pyruvyl transferase family protein [Nocardioides malaquae]MBE7324814.1 polysaccharide pyruvyl transferase family protein [Nocardioides malaquae]
MDQLREVGEKEDLNMRNQDLTAGVVCLGEAGNLGDDLILISVTDSLLTTGLVKHVQFTSHGIHLPWSRIAADLGWSGVPRARTVRNRAGLRERKALLGSSDVIIFGGGGLFQDVHDPMRPYQWLSLIPEGKPVLGIGLGFGPLSARSIRFLGGIRNPFDQLHVRDDRSAEFPRRLGWPVERAEDCVTPSLVSRLLPESPGEGTRNALGIALRAWPGLDAGEVADWVDEVARRHGCEEVEAFVLETTPAGPDAAFTKEVLGLLRTPGELVVYEPARIQDFLVAMAGCGVVVSMKLHSSAIWSFFGATIYPITYAPKTSALFGLEWRGLEIVREARQAVLLDTDVPTTEQVIARWIHGERSVPIGPMIRQPKAALLATLNFASLATRKIARRLLGGRGSRA